MVVRVVHFYIYFDYVASRIKKVLLPFTKFRKNAGGTNVEKKDQKIISGHCKTSRQVGI